tara:strand:+ start:438 stop:902 length:465 start_codon:yes stop_codon:yes gene_type:complete
MSKKFFLLIILFTITSQCGFSPIYLNKTNVNFSITSMELEGNRTINNFLKNNLNQYKNDKYDKKFQINIKTDYKKNTLSKNKSAETTNYELIFITKFEIRYNNEFKIITVSENEIMENISDDFEEQKNERSSMQNFASLASKKLTTELSILNVN